MKSIYLVELKEKIRRLEGYAPVSGSTLLTLGHPVLDQALPAGGLKLGCLHEVGGPPGDASRFGFVAMLAGRAAGSSGAVLWCRHQRDQENGAPYGTGLSRFGLSPERAIFVVAASAADCLWAMEDGLRSGHLAAVIGEDVEPDNTASRRLQLAAETGGTPAFMLPRKDLRTRVAALRWRIETLASATTADGFSRPRWRVALERCRNGAPNTWDVEWNDAALCFAVAADLADRSPQAAVS